MILESEAGLDNLGSFKTRTKLERKQTSPKFKPSCTVIKSIIGVNKKSWKLIIIFNIL